MTDITMTKSAADAGATILCVDDEPNILAALRRLFRSRGYRVLTAESGKAGLELLETDKADIIISDMRMPEMNGAAFLASVRARWPGTIRLLLTGHADVQLIQDAIERGEIFRYFSKPWNDMDLLQAVLDAREIQKQESSF